MNKTGCRFDKPFSKEIFGSERGVFYAYPREQLISEPIFPYFVLDGGAFNFANDRFGTADGGGIRELTVTGKLFDAFCLTEGLTGSVRFRSPAAFRNSLRNTSGRYGRQGCI